jgi:uncharacterized protein (DUF1015 family)
MSMYLQDQWYALERPASPGAGPLDALDVAFLQDRVLAPLLGIDDPRTSQRLGFVGGIRGAQELERLVAKGDYACAFALQGARTI